MTNFQTYPGRTNLRSLNSKPTVCEIINEMYVLDIIHIPRTFILNISLKIFITIIPNFYNVFKRFVYVEFVTKSIFHLILPTSTRIYFKIQSSFYLQLIILIKNVEGMSRY